MEAKFKKGNVEIYNIFMLFLVLFFVTACSDEKERPMPPKFDGEVTALYLAGTSTAKLVNLGMTSEDGNLYTYEGVLNTGELYFQTEKGNDTNVFKRGENENSILLDGSYPFSITDKGIYKLEVNVENRSIKMSSTKLGDVLYMVGPPVDTWEGVRGGGLACSDSDPFVFTYTHFFFAGLYKFLLQTDNLLAKFVPDKDSKAPKFFATEEDLIAAGYEAENWNLEAQGDYTITVDLAQNKVNISPVTFYPEHVDSVFIIGNKYGWDMNRGATPLEKVVAQDGVFRITDDFEAGEFKFLLQRHCFRPAIVKVSETEMVYIPVPTDEQDKKWNITVPGNYTITLNVKKNSIQIVKN